MPDAPSFNACPTCGTPLQPGQKECPNCGTVISPGRMEGILSFLSGSRKASRNKARKSSSGQAPREVALPASQTIQAWLDEAHTRELAMDLAGTLEIYQKALAFAQEHQRESAELPSMVQTLKLLINQTKLRLADTSSSAAEAFSPLPPSGDTDLESGPAAKGSTHRSVKKLLLVVFGLVGLAALGLALVFGFDKFLPLEQVPSPTPSSTPRPTPTRTSSPSPSPVIWDVDIQDSFPPDDGDWPLYRTQAATCGSQSTALENGAYLWTILDNGGCIWRISPKSSTSLSDFTASVDLRRISGPRASNAGLLFRNQDINNRYYFGINDSQQRYAFLIYRKGWQQIIKWTSSSAIVTGGVNRLEIAARGSSFSFSINGTVVAAADDDQIPSGIVEVAAQVNQSGATLSLEIDNFILYGNR